MMGAYIHAAAFSPAPTSNATDPKISDKSGELPAVPPYVAYA